MDRGYHKLPALSYHAHWDCPSGVSGYGMLAACLDASDKEDAQRQLNEIAKMVQKSFPQKLNNFSFKMVRTATAMHVWKVHKRASDELDTGRDNLVPSFHNLPQVNRSQVESMLENADVTSIPKWVKEKSLEVLQEIAKAASDMFHTDTVSPVHIDYSLDMVIEVVATLLSLFCLKVRTVSCGPIPLGGGFDGITTPQPAPLTLHLLAGMATCTGPPGLTGEFVTATGAALLRVLTCASAAQSTRKRPPTMTLCAVGLGTCETQHVVRLSVGEVASGEIASAEVDESEQHSSKVADAILTNKNKRLNIESGPPPELENLMTQVEANVNDITAEQLSFVIRVIMENGAVDAWITPIVTKNGEAAHTLHCLLRSDSNAGSQQLKRMLEVIFKQANILSVRVQRHSSSQDALIDSKSTPQLPHMVNRDKQEPVYDDVYHLCSNTTPVKPELRDCQKIVSATGSPLNILVEHAAQAARNQITDDDNADVSPDSSPGPSLVVPV